MLGLRRRLGQNYAWVVAGVTFLALLASAGLRSAPGVLMTPLHSAFGWDRGTLSATSGSLAGTVTYRPRPDFNSGSTGVLPDGMTVIATVGVARGRRGPRGCYGFTRSVAVVPSALR